MKQLNINDPLHMMFGITSREMSKHKTSSKRRVMQPIKLFNTKNFGVIKTTSSERGFKIVY